MAESGVDIMDFKEAIRAVIKETLAEIAFERTQLLPDGKLAVDEKEAAELLSLNPWQLRDLRREGRIDHHRIVGGRVRYTADHLLAYLSRGHEPPAAKRGRKPA